MKIILSVCAVLLSCSLASAKTLVYEADFNAMKYTNKDFDENSLDICGYPKTFSMDAKAPISSTFLKKMFPFGTVKQDRIESSNGATVPGARTEAERNAKKPYSGDYRTKVYVVKQSWPDMGSYKPYIAYRYEMVTYGSTAAPSGFVVSTELLNHRHSAELAEGDGCGFVSYKLISK